MSDLTLLHPHNLVTQAVDQAHAVEDPQARAEYLEELALVALGHEQPAVSRELLLDLEDLGARGAVLLALCEQALEAGDPTQARTDLAGVAAILDTGRRWRPRQGFVGPAPVTGRVAELAVRLGGDEDFALARRLALLQEGAASARAWMHIAAARVEPEPDLEAWDAARAAIRAAHDDATRRRLLVDFADLLVRAGHSAGAAVLAREALTGDAEMDWLQQALLLEGVARSLARGGLLPVATWAWEQALDVLVEGRHDPARAVVAVCRLAEGRAGPLGDDAAAEMIEIGRQLLAALPLDEEACPPDPWGQLREQVDAIPGAAGPLVAALEAAREAVQLPDAWRFVLGRHYLEQSRQAEALAEATRLEASAELPGRAMGVVLRVLAGEVISGRQKMGALLAEAPPGTELRLPVGRAPLRPLEHVFVGSLLDAASVRGACEVARLAVDPVLRASALVEVAEAARVKGELRLLRTAADEALAACREAEGDALARAGLLRRLGVLRGQVGDPEAASEALAELVAATAGARPATSLRLLGETVRELRAHKVGPLGRPLMEAALQGLIAASDAEARVGGVLGWLEGLLPPST